MGYNVETKKPPSFYNLVNRQELESHRIRQILVISDLHISEGYSAENFYWNRRENFMADAALAHFLQTKSAAVRQSHHCLWLIINGDFIDFLRVTATPVCEEDLQRWGQTLECITQAKLPQQRHRILTAFDEFAQQWRHFVLEGKPRWQWPRDIRDEFTYGFKTHDFKSIYRLMLVQRGHQAVFQSLAQWLADGHFLTIIPGNHDPEFDQELVQAGFLWMLENAAQNVGRRQQAEPALAEAFVFANGELSALGENEAQQDFAWGTPIADWEAEVEVEAPAPNFSERLRFEKHGLDVDGKIRLEHGHRFEWTTSTGEQQLDSKRHPHEEIFLAPGSLFNRYLINQIELDIPHLDNVKPTALVINYLMKHRPLQFLKLLGMVLKAGFRLARKRGARRLVWAGVLSVAQYLIPAPYVAWLLLTLLRFGKQAWQMIWNGPQIAEIPLPFYAAVPILIALFIIVARLRHAMQLDFSAEKAQAEMSRQFGATTGTRYAIYGHTHRPTMQRWENNLVHLNSGAWTPVFEYESGVVRNDLTLTFVQFDANGKNWKAQLLRWEPLNRAATEVILVAPR